MANQNKKLNQRRRKTAILKENTPVSMHALLRGVGMIAAQVNEDYYSCKCEIIRNSSGILNYEYWVYIKNHNWHIGNTPAEALTRLRKAVTPFNNPPADVVIGDWAKY